MKKIIIFITFIGNNCMQHCSQTLVPHPRTSLVQACFTQGAYDITHIVEAYAKDSCLEAQSDKFYACAYSSGWITNGNVVLYGPNGNVLKNFKANNISAITLSPDKSLLFVLHTVREDPGFLFLGYLCSDTAISCFSLHDDLHVTELTGNLNSRKQRCNDIQFWPNIHDELIKKFSIDTTGKVTVERYSQKVLTQQGFMHMIHGQLQEKRKNLMWWSNLFQALTTTCLREKVFKPPFGRILPSVYKILQRTIPQ